ncbi:MAG TPA: RNA methyltransferase [Gemmatimonadaceae bacterium]|nr:RNA methyltransferase [Gemmatimonadaceae bacterium]
MSKLLTLARDLRRRKARERQGLFVAEGVRTVEEVLRSTVAVRGLLIAPELDQSERGAALLEQARQRGLPIEQVSSREFESAAETESPQGVLAVGVVPEHRLGELDPAPGFRLLVLDAVQDPGNVGTMLRTAAALGVAATFSLPGTVDLWNAKVVRSAMGAHFHHPCSSGTWDDLDAFRRDRSVAVWAADASGEVLDGPAAPDRLALVVGNEGSGLSSASRARADRLVALRISAAVESLNVAVAAGILLYELRR